jgi:iron complex outermembrane receptor protein
MAHMFQRYRAAAAFIAYTAVLLPAASTAQPTGAQTSGSSQDDPALRFKMPTVNVTAQKQEQDKQKLPVSVTAVPQETLENAGVHIVSDAAIFAPNTFFTEWTARKLSFARFRGISSSNANNPGITTFVDGVPQLSGHSSSLELLDTQQIEFIRGPQSALFGRNTLGGLVNVTSARPALGAWTGSLSIPFGNYSAWGVRGGVSGPVVKDKVSLGVSFAQVSRDGFTVNDVTGTDIDNRDAFTAKAQLLWLPTSAWETRVIVTGESARDGDYGLGDVAALRANPFHVARDFEGEATRDVFGTTIQARHLGRRITFSSTTGFVNWESRDITDLDYTPFPILTRDNTENDFQFTQEVRFASADGAALQLGNGASLRWQAGLFFFTQSYEQDAINGYAAGLVAPFPVSQHTPRSALDDVGIGLFGQGTLSFGERLDLVAGARFDYEDKSATLEDFFDSPFFPSSSLEADDSFSNVSPQLALAYRIQPDKSVYASVTRGYKAGGFNPAAPVGSESYGEENAWHVEGGVKTLFAGDRVSANAAVFYIDWDDLQLFTPNPAVPTQFYISNVGGASSKGVEFEVAARPAPGFDVFTSIGYTDARFGAGSVSSRINVEDNSIPNTPEYTVSAGLQYSRNLGPARLVGRADAVFYGAFEYDDANTLGQDAYSLVNFRLGLTGRFLMGEVMLRNAFDTRYIPLAFAYRNFAPSGFVGEMGAPRTLTVSAGVRF